MISSSLLRTIPSIMTMALWKSYEPGWFFQIRGGPAPAILYILHLLKFRLVDQSTPIEG